MKGDSEAYRKSLKRFFICRMTTKPIPRQTLKLKKVPSKSLKIICFVCSKNSSVSIKSLFKSTCTGGHVGQCFDSSFAGGFAFGAHALELVDSLTELVDLRERQNSQGILFISHCDGSFLIHESIFIVYLHHISVVPI